MSYNYDIHGLVRVRSDVELPLPEYFRSDTRVSSPDIKFFEDDLDFERPEKCDVMRIGSYYWLDGDELRFEHPEGAKLELNLKRMRIRFNSRFAKLSLKATLESLLDRMLQMTFLDKGYVMVHAGCVAFDDSCSLIVAPSDFGKTSTVLSLVARGADFLGDDHVFINRNGTALSYPRKLTISPHTITSEVVKPVGFWKRALTKLPPLYAVVLRLFGNQAESRKVPEEIIKNRASISHVFALKGFAPNPQVKPSNSAEFVEQMFLSMPYMTGYPDSYADLYLYLMDIGLKEFIDDGMKILEDALEDIECYEVKGPKKESWAEAIRERLG